MLRLSVNNKGRAMTPSNSYSNSFFWAFYELQPKIEKDEELSLKEIAHQTVHIQISVSIVLRHRKRIFFNYTQKKWKKNVNKLNGVGSFNFPPVSHPSEASTSLALQLDKLWVWTAFWCFVKNI